MDYGGGTCGICIPGRRRPLSKLRQPPYYVDVFKPFVHRVLPLGPVSIHRKRPALSHRPYFRFGFVVGLGVYVGLPLRVFKVKGARIMEVEEKEIIDTGGVQLGEEFVVWIGTPV